MTHIPTDPTHLVVECMSVAHIYNPARPRMTVIHLCRDPDIKTWIAILKCPDCGSQVYRYRTRAGGVESEIWT